MSKSLHILAGVALIASAASAQITILNSASAAPNPFVAVVGTAITIDTVQPNVGGGCARRAVAPAAPAANAAYVPIPGTTNPVNGFTIQFWIYRTQGQQANGSPDYIFGDPTMVAPAAAGASGGVFRCFMNGAAGVGNLLFRGVSNQIVTAGGLVLQNVWTHVAYRYNPVNNTLSVLFNGVVTNSVLQATVPFVWTGSALSLVGSSHSTSTTAPYFMDDLRVYNFARTDADIAADFGVAAAGNGPSGAANLPDRAYFDFEGSVQPHFCRVGIDLNPINTSTKIFTTGTLLEWDGDSPAGDLPASALINIHGPSTGTAAYDPYNSCYRTAPALPAVYSTPTAPGIEVGHGYSTPVYPLAIAFPDGLNLNSLPGLVVFAVPGVYTYQTSPSAFFPVPPAIFQSGDSIHIQFLAPDAAYPLGLGTSNRAAFIYSDCNLTNPGPHAHIEARGNGAIQVSTFWEAWNTGTWRIQRVTVDASTCVANGGTATGFLTTGFLNSGGNLAAGSSYRNNSEVYTGLVGVPPGFTGLLPGAAGVFGALQFDFPALPVAPGFDACVDEFQWDCESQPANTTGNAFIGATVTVIFEDPANPGVTSTLGGLMIADPNATNAAIIDI